MGFINNKTLLVLTILLLVISLLGSYAVMTKTQLLTETPSSTASGVVELKILQRSLSPPVKSTGLVTLIILNDET